MRRLSFQRALGIQEHDRWGELSEQLNYSQHFDTAVSRVMIDVRTSQIVGLLTLSGDAKARSPHGLTLYTFKRNTGAQQFYLSQGFVETARGFDSFDRNP